MQCLRCDKKALPEESLCRQHFIEAREEIWSDNSHVDPKKWGIFKWLKDNIPEAVENEFPEFHYEIYALLFELYDPFYINKQERLREIIAYRGSSKSGVIFNFFCYIITHNKLPIKIRGLRGEVKVVIPNEKLMVIASETGNLAEDFVVRIRDEISSNGNLRYFYKFAIEDAMDAIEGQWTKRAFKINGLFVLGVGQGMQIRGRIKGVSRPTFIVFDDIYSAKNTVTEDNRRKIKNWFNTEAMNTVDDLRGKGLLVGTIVHDDTVIVECKKNKGWKTLEFPVMDHKLFQQLVAEHIKCDFDKGKAYLPFDEVDDEMERLISQREYFDKLQKTGEWKLAWAERASLYFLALKYKEQYDSDNIAGFYQEYFHITIPDEGKQFKKEYFQKLPPWEITHEFGYTWFWCNQLYHNDNGETIPQLITIEFGLDTAAGLSTSDDSVIVVVGATGDGRRYVLHVEKGKYSQRDQLTAEHPSYNRIDKVIMDRSYLVKRGWMDESFRLAKKFRPKLIKLGVAGSEIEKVGTMRKLFRANLDYTNIIARPQTTDKFDRIKNTLVPHYETMMVWHCVSQAVFDMEYQLEFLSAAKHDDLADADEVAFFGLTEPVQIEYQYFQPNIETKKILPKWVTSRNNFNNILEDHWRSN